MKPKKRKILDLQLRAAYKMFQSKNVRNAPDDERGLATRKFLQLILTVHQEVGNADFKKRLKALLRINSNSRRDEYLAAARFAALACPVGSDRSTRILDLSKSVLCPSVSQMAKAFSFFESKDEKKQSLGREYLYCAVRGEELPSVADMKLAVNNRRFKISLTGISLPPPYFFRSVAAFLADLASHGDKSAFECLQGLSRAVSAGGNVELKIEGVYKTKLPADAPLGKEILAEVFDSQSTSLSLSDAAEMAKIQEWIISGTSQPVALSTMNVSNSKQTSKWNYWEEKEEARKERIRIKTERIRLKESSTGGVPGRILTGIATREEMFAGVSVGWEGADSMEFEFADIVAENSYDAEKQVKESLKILAKPLREKRIGIIIFPREPAGWVEERLLVEAFARRAAGNADAAALINIPELVKKVHEECSELPIMAAESAVRDALFMLRKKLKHEPGEKDVLFQAIRELKCLRSNVGSAADLGDVVAKLGTSYPNLPRTTLNAKAANACMKLREKYGFEPDADTIFREAFKIIKRN